MQSTRHTRPEGHLKYFFSRSRCHLLLGLKQGYPLYLRPDVGLGIINMKPGWCNDSGWCHNSPTHTLLIKHQTWIQCSKPLGHDTATKVTCKSWLVWQSHKAHVCAGLSLKGRYTFGNCQRPALSLGVSQHKHKITNLWKCLSCCHCCPYHIHVFWLKILSCLLFVHFFKYLYF